MQAGNDIGESRDWAMGNIKFARLHTGQTGETGNFLPAADVDIISGLMSTSAGQLICLRLICQM